jgi:hypothetical protein
VWLARRWVSLEILTNLSIGRVSSSKRHVHAGFLVHLADIRFDPVFTSV